MNSPALLRTLELDELWTLLDAATLGVWKWHVPSDTVEWSARLHETMGTAPGEHSDLNYSRELVHPDDRDVWSLALEQTRDHGEVFSLDARLRRADGRFFWGNINGIWIDSGAHARATLLGFVLDVSEVRQAREALQRSEARFRAFFDHAPIAAYLKDRQLRHIYANEAAARIAGMGLDELIGKDCRQVFASEVAARLEQVDRKVLEGHTVETWQGAVSPRGGEERRIFDVKFPVQELESEDLLVGGFGVDVTEQQLAQERLQASQRLESLGVLAGGVAHDFNNLLVGILGHAELARDTEPAPTKEHLETIAETARRASELCEQLLVYAGKGVEKREVIHVPSFIRESGSLLELSVKRRATLTYEIDDECPNVEIDRGQLRQVLLNLTLNAAQASSASSHDVEIRCDHVEGLEEDHDVLHDWTGGEGPFLHLVVQDRGEGMTRETATRIFDPFFTTKAEGHGLGLAAVLGIVRRGHGALGVQTEPGRGTTISVYFPTTQARATEPKPPAPAPESSVAVHGRALVIDDEATVADVCGMLLERMDLEVTIAHSGEAALRELDAWRPDLVVLDLTMPAMSGLEVLEALRHRYPTIPVVLSSGYTEEDLSVVLDEHTSFLRKPYTARQFRSAIHGVLEGSHQSGE